VLFGRDNPAIRFNLLKTITVMLRQQAFFYRWQMLRASAGEDIKHCCFFKSIFASVRFKIRVFGSSWQFASTHSLKVFLSVG